MKARCIFNRFFNVVLRAFALYMSILDRLFNTHKSAKTQPDIAFGRYYAYKSPAQTAAWERSVTLFDEGKVLAAYGELMRYFLDDRESNITWTQSEDRLEFALRQGSRLITGVASPEYIKAESKVAKVEDLNVGFLRRLIEHNFTLRFCRFALTPDNCLAIVFDTSTLDGSPNKLEQALRELALHADKQDDLLLDEFRMLKPADERNDPDVPEAEKAIKYHYMRSEIESAFALLDQGRPDPEQYPGGYAYLLLGLAFRLDYLIRPEGFMMDVLEKVFSTYFSKDNQAPAAKLRLLRREFQRLLDRPQEALFAEMYRTRSTFGINPATNHERIKSLIDSELPKMDWHLSQKHADTICLAVPKYIVGYGLFHFAPPRYDRDMFQLLFRITESSFFENLGFERFIGGNGLPDKKLVERALRQIQEQNHTEYPNLKIPFARLQYDNMPLFSQSFLTMMRDTTV